MDHERSSSEQARDRRRDREATARHRDGMQTGLLKTFHTVNQVWARDAAQAPKRKGGKRSR